jgi:hypothetical protein
MWVTAERNGGPGPVEGVTIRGDRATAMFQDIWCRGIRGYAAPGPLALVPERGQIAAMSDVSPLAQAPHGCERAAGAVNATQLGVHLGLTRQRIAALADVEHVIERLADGRFDQDACRLAYLKWLRDPARRSARTEADADYVKVKTEMLRLRLLEKKHQLMPMDDVNEMIDQMVGLFLTGLSGFAARCGGRDLAVRREIDRAVFDLRTEISEAASKLADERGEPDQPRPAASTNLKGG